MSSSKSAYVIESEHPAETVRLFEQSKLFTRAMGVSSPTNWICPVSGACWTWDVVLGSGQAMWPSNIQSGR